MFLRAQREKISPAAIGLAADGRRRTPGLRREEVAQLSGLSVPWYTWIEQGSLVLAGHPELTLTILVPEGGLVPEGVVGLPLEHRADTLRSRPANDSQQGVVPDGP